jgi:hypothetical protein
MSGIISAVIAMGCGLQAVSAQQVAQAAGAPPADFGTPPSGEVPILFNDRHVYSKPDRLKANRVLAALVRGNTILIPLRSMFEQMGATVSYDPRTKTADVSKPGSDVKVRVGDRNVIINGESRPLDVPPEIYKGAIVVPVRVISEGMGAYVQWVPEKKTVVVRYVAAPIPTAPPTAPPTPIPTPKPTLAPTATPTPTPAPKKKIYEHFVAGDYIFSPKVYNEFSPGNNGKQASFDVRGAVEFPLLGLPWMLEGDYRQFSFPHNNTGGPCNVPTSDVGCVTVIGGYNQTSVAAFTARDQDFEGKFGLKIIDPRIYIGVGYVYRTDNYGYPAQSGVGVGGEKLPDLDQPFSLYGSAFYYPQISGNFTWPTDSTTIYNGVAGQRGQLQYRYFKYQIGGDYNIANSGVFLDFGFAGVRASGKNYAPSGISENGPYVGLGLKF